MDPTLLQGLSDEVDRIFNNWTVTQLCLPLCSDPSGSPSPYNIANLANPKTQVTNKALKTALFLPANLPSPAADPITTGEEGTKVFANAELTNLVANVCQLAGFKSVLPSNNPNLAFPSITYGGHRGRCYKSSQDLLHPDSEKRRAKQPTRPLSKDEACSFRFSVYFSRDHNRWFIPLSMPGNMKHSGHAEAPPSQVQIAAGRLEKKELELIQQMLRRFLPISAIKSLVKCRTGKTFNYHQFYQLNNHKLARMKLEPSSNGKGTTPASRLLCKTRGME